MEIIIILKEIRKAHGLTQRQLADKIDLTKSTISRIERMEVDPTLRELVMIADALGVEYFDLFYINYD